MRTSLMPGLLSAMKRNVSFRSTDLKLYEIGKTFTPVPGQDLPREDLKLGGLATGARYPQLWHFQRGEVDERGDIHAKGEVDFYDVKGAVENLFEGLGVEDVSFVPSEVSFLHPTKSANLILDGQTIGVDEHFLVGGYEASGPHDPALPASETIRCGCTTILVFAD